MSLRLYNTLTKQMEAFAPLHPGKVTMYNCGPTVYGPPHIGNFRSFLFADLLRRTLDFKGLAVTQVMNLTDVGHLTQDEIEAGRDKMVEASEREKITIWDVAEKYVREFHALVDILRIRRAHHYPRATEHVPGMIEAVRRLVGTGAAYVSAGSVYFEVRKFPAYGRLSGNTLEELKAGHRIEVNPEKRDPLDFALWKHGPDHPMKWDSPWGPGYPGWHMECSVMAHRFLGETIDLHTGGEDNIFPHHESEIAQAESLTGKPFVRTWCHARHLLVEGKKMSKSAGNFFTVRELLEAGAAPETLRLALLKVHYRRPLNFSRTKELADAAETVKKLRELGRRLAEAGAAAPASPAGDPTGPVDPVADRLGAGFEGALDDDLNVSEALGVLAVAMRDLNRLLDEGGVSPAGAVRARSVLERIDGVLGLGFLEARPETLDETAARLVAEREAARRAKNFARSDEIRRTLKDMGVILEDGPSGTRWRKE